MTEKMERFVRKNDRVYILGTASTLAMTPWEDPKADYWACAPVITNKLAAGRKLDLIFEMHPMDYWTKIIDRLNDCNFPCYMQQANPHVKKSMTFPLQDVKALAAGTAMENYFTSTIAYMIALAIVEGYKEICFYGVHMASEEEYGDQRRSCEAWTAYAIAKGIQTYIPPESELFHNRFLYGYEQADSLYVSVMHRKEGLENGLKKLETDMEDIKRRYNEQKGAIEDCKHWISVL